MKSIIRCFGEIFVAVLIIIGSFPIFKAQEVEAYESVAKRKYEEVEILVEDDFNYLSYVDNTEEVTPVVFLNNVENKPKSFKLVLVLDNISEDLMNNLFIKNTQELINLKELYLKKDGNAYYFLIDNVSLKEYEKTSYNLKLMLNEQYGMENIEGFNYKFIEQ